MNTKLRGSIGAVAICAVLAMAACSGDGKGLSDPSSSTDPTETSDPVDASLSSSKDAQAARDGSGNGNGQGDGGGNGNGNGAGNGGGNGNGNGDGGGNGGGDGGGGQADSGGGGGGSGKDFGAACQQDAECKSNACFRGGQQSYCSYRCTAGTAATTCPVPPTNGQCNNQGYCRKP